MTTRLFAKAVSVFGFALAMGISSAAYADDSFKVAELAGQAWVTDVSNTGRKEIRQALKVGDELPLSSRVSTGHATILKLVRTGDIALEVQSDTELFLGPQALNSKDSVARLRHGALLSVVRNPEKRHNHFMVRTRAAVMGVRGTMFYVRSTPGDRDVFFCPCMGSVALKREGENEAVLTTKHHESPRLLPVGGKGEIKSGADVAKKNPGHSDEALGSLKKLLE